MPRYFVSGVIQIEVIAKDAEQAGRRAEARARTLMRSPTLNIGIEADTAEPVRRDLLPPEMAQPKEA